MSNFGLSDLQRVMLSLAAALAFSTICIGAAVAPANAAIAKPQPAKAAEVELVHIVAIL
ncbi:hypothetical protein [Sphingomonas oleivorans]|uniref:hypothetical protein n=1 Tax=Sphingomonas oleivorans TaxID=1735121 RepID=UPI0013FE1279|nr:hypothetical protein [Sphingomonas oleivorans]